MVILSFIETTKGPVNQKSDTESRLVDTVETKVDQK